MRKNELLQILSEETIFRKYINHDFKLNKLFCSEIRKDHHPTVNIFKYKNKILYKDFGTGETYDCVSYVQTKYNCNFKEAIDIIVNDFHLTELNIPITKEAIISNKKNIDSIQKKNYIFGHIESKWTDENLWYWEQYGINEQILKFYNVLPLKEYYKVNLITNRIYRYKSIKEEPIFAFPINNNIKYYNPLTSLPILKWKSNINSKDIFGYDQSFLLTKGIVGIVAGNKDTLTMYANLQIPCISMSSEAVLPQKELIDYYNKKSIKLFVLYDNDKTGITQSTKIADMYNIKVIFLNNILHYSIFDHKNNNGIKDISDYYKYIKENNIKDIFKNYLFNELKN